MVQEGRSGPQPRSGDVRHPAITAAAILFFLNAGWVVSFLLIGGYVVLNGDLPWAWGAPHGRIYDAFGLPRGRSARMVSGTVDFTSGSLRPSAPPEEDA